MPPVLLGGADIPQDVTGPGYQYFEDRPAEFERVMATRDDWISPGEAQIIFDEAEARRVREREEARLAAMLAEAERAKKEYYKPGGKGYGTTPGGPDVTYWQVGTPETAKWIYEGLDPIYGEGGVLEPVTDLVTGQGDTRENLLLYGALAIGALALLRR
jgi:hypothetical protein